MIETLNKIKIQPPSRSIVAPCSPSISASFDVRIWLLPSKNVDSRPARTEVLDKLHPEIEGKNQKSWKGWNPINEKTKAKIHQDFLCQPSKHVNCPLNSRVARNASSGIILNICFIHNQFSNPLLLRTRCSNNYLPWTFRISQVNCKILPNSFSTDPMDYQLLSHWQLRDESRSKMRRKLMRPMITAKDARGQYTLRYTTLEQAKRWTGRNLKSDLNSSDYLLLNVFNFLFMHDLAWSNYSRTLKERPTILKNLTCFQWHRSKVFSETKSMSDTSILHALIPLLPLL